MNGTVIMPEHGQFFECELDGDILIICPSRDLTEVICQQLRASDADLVSAYDGSQAKHVVVDCHHTTAFSSSALELFVRLWKSIRTRSGHMAFCNLSDQEKEILQLTRLNLLWNIAGSQDEARRSVGQ
jgi:anti-sigma B factor antagonist